MEDVFKKLRQRNRRPDIQSFADALFGGRAPFAPMRGLEGADKGSQVENRPEAQAQAPEQQKTLESLKRFTQEMAEKQGEAKVKFPGGEISTRPSTQDQFYEVDMNYPQSVDELLLSSLGHKPEAEVVFVGEKTDQEQVAMLSRMISAMKVSEEKVLRVPLSEELDFENPEVFQKQFESIVQLMGFVSPKVVIPLGGKAVSLLFGKKRRLSQVRGKFYSLGIKFRDEKNIDTQMIPIFHPEYLLANPGMKRTAWEDLQKIMKYLGVKT